MIYKYLISYINVNSVTNTLEGCGRLEFTRNRKIKTIEDIESIEKLITDKHGYSRVIVNNYILMSRKIGRFKK